MTIFWEFTSTVPESDIRLPESALRAFSEVDIRPESVSTVPEMLFNEAESVLTEPERFVIVPDRLAIAVLVVASPQESELREFSLLRVRPESEFETDSSDRTRPESDVP